MEQLFAGWSVMRRTSVIVASALALQACGDDADPGENGEITAPSATTCLPKNSSLAAVKSDEVTRASNFTVYIDRSQSMAGFNRGATQDLRALGDLLALISERATEYQNAEFYAFGKEIKEIPASQLASFGSTAPFDCQSCDNQESRLDNVLKAATTAGKDTVSLIITDLWLDNRSLTATPQIALGQPLRQALQDGMSIGVIGILAPFNGAVYDVPGVGTYRGAKELPLYVLAIGPEEDISNFQINLKQSGGSSFSSDRMNYSLFSKEPNNPVIPAQLRAIGAGASRNLISEDQALRGVDQYLLQLGVAGAQNGRLGKTIRLNDTLREGLVWWGNLAEFTNAWQLNADADLEACGADTWTEISGIRGLWQLRPDGEQATFSFGPEIQSQLLPGNVYYLETHVGSSQLAVPNKANQWMRDWSLDAENARQLVDAQEPAFKTLNLRELTTILERELSRATGDSRKAASFGFLLKVER